MTNHDTSQWYHAITHMIALADRKDIRTLGITATQADAGTSLLAQAITESYVGFGRKTLLAYSRNMPEVPELATLSLPDALDADLPLNESRNQFSDLTARYDMSVVDLPPVSSSPGRSTPEFMRYAPLCDMIFLICVTNTTTREELTDCVDQCAIHKLNIGGIVMNDYQLVGSQLMSA